jgi:hypothetical protein
MSSGPTFSLHGFIVSWIARLFYLSSLTSLIPFGAVLVKSGFTHIGEQLGKVPIAAIILLGLSILVLLFFYHNLAHTLASLGWMTFLPGLGGVFFMLFNREQVFGALASVFSGFALVEPFIIALQASLPQVWAFIIGYVALGFVLIHIAGRIEREHALTTTLKNVFGPRVRILR